MTLAAYISQCWRSASAFAQFLGVSVSLVSMWSNGTRRIPMQRALDIEARTGGMVRRETMRPDVNWKRPGVR